MKRANLVFGSFITVLVAGMSAYGQAPPAFTYQGRLTNGGSPVNGSHDLQFKLFDLAAAGSQLGATTCVDNVSVVDGLFTVQLNAAGEFGPNAFIGAARYLEIAVRADGTPANCAGGAAYTPFTTRQPVTATPMATYATNSPGSGLWEASGAAISNTNSGFVGIGRTATVSSAEYFGIQAPASGTNYGGMYIRTDSNQARPFYGYKAGTAGADFSAWTQLNGATGNWEVVNGGFLGTPWMALDREGNLGIGDLTPDVKLDVEGNSAGDVLYVTNTGTGRCAQFYVSNADTASGIYAVTYGGGYAGSFEAHNTNTTAALNCYKNGGPALRCISTLSTPGAAATDAAVAIVGGSDSEPTGGGFLVLGTPAGANISIDNNEIMARNNGAVATLFLNNDGGDVVIGPGSTTTVGILQINGADVAEKFPVSETVKPGMVVAIDKDNPGKLCLARGAYNRRVAGVVSGANDFPVGAVLGHQPGLEDAPPVALSGRVYVWCDATESAIESGDQLTTSDRAGHAMAVRDQSRAGGAVLGKAMTELAKGETGLVLALVNLQ